MRHIIQCVMQDEADKLAVLPPSQTLLKSVLNFTFGTYYALFQTPSFRIMNKDDKLAYSMQLCKLFLEPQHAEDLVHANLRHLVQPMFSSGEKVRIAALSGQAMLWDCLPPDERTKEWDRLLPFMRDDHERADLWVMLYPNVPEEAWTELTGQDASPSKRRRFKLKLAIKNRMHAELLYALQKRLQGLTSAQIKFCIHRQLKGMSPHSQVLQQCSRVYEGHHPYVIYMMFVDHCAALQQLPVFSPMNPLKRKKLFQRTKLLFRPDECKGDSDWHKTILLKSLDRRRHCSEESTRFALAAVDFEAIRINLRNKLVAILKPAVANGVVSDAAYAQLIARFQAENSAEDASLLFQAIAAKHELEPREAIRTSVQTMYASKVLRMMEKEKKRLLEEILNFSDVENLQALFDSRDMNVVYETIISHRTEILNGIPIHAYSMVEALCNKTVHAIWRHWFPMEAKKLEDENRARIIEKFGESDAKEALSRFIANTLCKMAEK